MGDVGQPLELWAPRIVGGQLPLSAEELQELLSDHAQHLSGWKLGGRKRVSGWVGGWVGLGKSPPSRKFLKGKGEGPDVEKRGQCFGLGPAW